MWPVMMNYAPAAELRGHGGPVRAMTLISDGTLASASFDQTIILWNIEGGTAQKVLRFHDGAVSALVAIRGDCFASGGEDGRVARWCNKSIEPERVYAGHAGPVTALAVSPDGKLLASASFDRTVRLWNLLDPKVVVRIIEGNQGPVNGIAFSAQSDVLFTAGYDATLRKIPLKSGDVPKVLQLASPLNALLRVDGELVVATAGGELAFFTLALDPTAELAIRSGPLTSLAASASGDLLATAGLQGNVTLVSRSDRSVTGSIEGPGLPVWSLAWALSGETLLTGGADRVIRRWDGRTGKALDDVTIVKSTSDLPRPEHPGARVFRACHACHGVTAADTNLAGPTLHNLYGRRIASHPQYAYSAALRGLDIIWTPETVAKLFEIGPSVYTPGTKMPEQTITSAADRAALVEWLGLVTR
jgi:cytochrome c